MIIDKLTNSARQQLTYILSTNEEIILKLEYKVRISKWSLSIEYKDKIINNILITSSIDNILYQYDRILPFKLRCNTTTGFSPYFIDDFINGNNNLEIIEDGEE